MPFLRNVSKSDTNKVTLWVTMSNGHLVWSFILRALNCHSNLNLPSNHIISKIDTPNLLKTCNCLLTGLRSIMYQYICNILNFKDMFLSITTPWGSGV